MDLPTVIARLNDLPTTFRREGPPYEWLIESVGLQLAQFTIAADSTSLQVLAFGTALDGWLNVWGLLWGVPRAANEANSIYSTRIARTVLAWVGTVPAIQAWLNFYAPGGTITENLPTVGYSINLPAAMSPAAVQAFLFSLGRIRPAGVPFTVTQTGIGIYLGTETFIGTGLAKASYLTSGTIPVTLSIGASTPNSIPLLPGLYFSDPTLNPSLAQ